MAQFTKVSGTTQPVFAIDVGNGSISGTANVAANGAVQMQGPRLDFFSLVANSSVASGGNVNGFINNTLQAIQQTTTVALYEVGPTNTILNLAVYPTGAANTTTILAQAIQANGTGGLTTVGWAAAYANAQFNTVAYAAYT
jgi:hypothetical protein